MLAFRSGATVERWCQLSDIPRGETFAIEQAWELGRDWYSDKLSPDWRRASADEAQAIFAGIGLTSDFWRLG